MPTTSRNSAIQPSRLVNPDSIQLDFDESFVKASTLDTDNAYFGDADFLIDRRLALMCQDLKKIPLLLQKSKRT
jgi:hypothetical protein